MLKLPPAVKLLPLMGTVPPGVTVPEPWMVTEGGRGGCGRANGGRTRAATTTTATIAPATRTGFTPRPLTLGFAPCPLALGFAVFGTDRVACFGDASLPPRIGRNFFSDSVSE